MKTDYLIEQDMKRIVQLEDVIHQLVAKIDMGVSNIYDKENTIKAINRLFNTLDQMNSDLAALENLLDE